MKEHIVSIDHDEMQSMRAVRSKACEGSSSCNRPAITREERLRNFMEEGDHQARVVEALGTDRPPAKIQKVIFLLQDHKHFVKYFEPRVASVGPIHHGKPKYQLGEKYKLKLAYEFVQGCRKNINFLYEPVEKNIKQLRECFEEEVTKKYDDEALAWILFVDGCAILQYIFCAAPPTTLTATASNKFSELNIKNDSVAFAQQDLFLLENQVPYHLLKLLMEFSGKEELLRKSIERYIGNVTSLQMEPIEKREPTHLLDLLRTTLLGSLKSNLSSGESSDSQPKPTETKLTNLLNCMRKSLKSLRFPRKTSPKDDRDLQSYRNVQELKAAGIQLERSESSYLRNISFRRRLNFYPGFLSLPPITVDDSTGPKFMNLIAYEMCLDFKNDFGISSYISFLDSLIDEANDVKDMRKARVLHNFLGSDQEVADLFNEIGTDLVPNAEAYYKDVKLQIQGYYDNNWMTWMAQFFHDHFSSPWTTLAFIGVLLALILSLTQTWYAAHPPPSPCDDFCKIFP